jgi:hypothetical protein
MFGCLIIDEEKHQKYTLMPTAKLDFIYVSVFRSSRDSTVGISTGYGMEDRGVGVRVHVGSRIFSSPHCADRFWG